MTPVNAETIKTPVSKLFLEDLKAIPPGDPIVRDVPEWITEGGPRCQILTWPGVISRAIEASNRLIDRGEYADLPEVRIPKNHEGSTLYSAGRTKRGHSVPGTLPPIAFGAEHKRPHSYQRIQPINGPWLTDGFANAYQTAVARDVELTETPQNFTRTVPGFGLVNSLNLPNQKEIWHEDNHWFSRIILYSAAETMRFARQEAKCLFIDIDRKTRQEIRRQWKAMDRVIGGLNWGKKAGASIPDWAHMQFFLFAREFCMRSLEGYQVSKQDCTRCPGIQEKVGGSEIRRMIANEDPMYVYAPFDVPPNTKEGRVTRATTRAHYHDLVELLDTDPVAFLKAADVMWQMMNAANDLTRRENEEKLKVGKDPEDTRFNFIIAGSPKPRRARAKRSAHWYFQMYEGDSQGVNSILVPTVPHGRGRDVPGLSYIEPETTASLHRSTSRYS